MFSKLFSSAKSLLSVPPLKIKRQVSAGNSIGDDEMVTTRGQSSPSRLGEELDDKNTITVHVPSSNRKRPRAAVVGNHDSLDTPSSSRKRQRAVGAGSQSDAAGGRVTESNGKRQRARRTTKIRQSEQISDRSSAELSGNEQRARQALKAEKPDYVVDQGDTESHGSGQQISPIEDFNVRKTRPVVEIPVKSGSPLQATSTPRATKKRRSAMTPKDTHVNDGENSDQESAIEFSDGEEHEVMWLKIPENRHPTTTKLSESQGWKYSMRNRLSQAFTQGVYGGPDSSYKNFASDGPDDRIFCTAPEQQELGGASEDDAPEELGSGAATRKPIDKGKGKAMDIKQSRRSSKKKQKVTKKGLKEQEKPNESENVTRGVERADNSERRTTRIRLLHEGIESRFGMDGTDDYEPVTDNAVEDRPPVAATLQETISIKQVEAGTPSKFTSTKLPYFLPLEYLDESEVRPELIFPPVPIQQMGKKIKFTDDGDHKYKDRRVGSTTFRIADVPKRHLAPKASTQAKSTKEAWLMGRAGNGTTTVKKPVKSGFFK